MKDIIANITANVLTALYQPFWFSVALSVLALFFYLFENIYKKIMILDRIKSSNMNNQKSILWNIQIHTLLVTVI